MRPPLSMFVVCGLALAFVCADALAGNRHGFGNAETGCSVESAYTLRVDDRGVRLDADGEEANPRRIAFHGGVLRVDGAEKAVSAADARRLREMESETRELLPEIAGITREAIGITFDALGSVNVALTGSKRNAREFERLRTRALARIDDTLGRGIWNPETFGDAFEAEIEAAAESMAASFTPRRALWMVMTGGVGRLERRMEKMEVELERSIDAREEVLERHAAALCRRLGTLNALQEAMDVRLDDGRPLRVFEFREGNAGEEAGLQVSRRR